MQPVYAVVCDFALVSQDRKPTIVGVFTDIRVPTVPFQWPRFAFAGRVELDLLVDAGTHSIALTVKDPAGVQLSQITGSVVFGPGPQQAGRAMFDPHMVFDNFIFGSFGRYTLELTIDGLPMGTATLDISHPIP